MTIQDLRDKVNNPELDPNMKCFLGISDEALNCCVSVLYDSVIEKIKYFSYITLDENGDCLDYLNEEEDVFILFNTLEGILDTEQKSLDSKIELRETDPEYQKFLELKEKFGY